MSNTFHQIETTFELTIKSKDFPRWSGVALMKHTTKLFEMYKTGDSVQLPCMTIFDTVNAVFCRSYNKLGECNAATIRVERELNSYAMAPFMEEICDLYSRGWSLDYFETLLISGSSMQEFISTHGPLMLACGIAIPSVQWAINSADLESPAKSDGPIVANIEPSDRKFEAVAFPTLDEIKRAVTEAVSAAMNKPVEGSPCKHVNDRTIKMWDNLPRSAKSKLLKAGIRNFKELLTVGRKRMLSRKGVGPATIKEVDAIFSHPLEYESWSAT